jgi:hypothetical protein
MPSRILLWLSPVPLLASLFSYLLLRRFAPAWEAGKAPRVVLLPVSRMPTILGPRRQGDVRPPAWGVKAA